MRVRGNLRVPHMTFHFDGRMQIVAERFDLGDDVLIHTANGRPLTMPRHAAAVARKVPPSPGAKLRRRALPNHHSPTQPEPGAPHRADSTLATARPSPYRYP